MLIHVVPVVANLSADGTRVPGGYAVPVPILPVISHSKISTPECATRQSPLQSSTNPLTVAFLFDSVESTSLVLVVDTSAGRHSNTSISVRQ